MQCVSVFYVHRLPIVGLQQHQSLSLAVYAVCPSSHPAAPAVAQLLVAACLAPCLPEAAAAAAVVQPLGGSSTIKQGEDVTGEEHTPPAQALPKPMDMASAVALAVDPLQPMDSSARHQPPSSPAAAGSPFRNAASAAAAQHNTPPEAPSGPAVSTPSAEAVAKYHGAALQTHMLKDAATATDIREAGPHVQPAECSPLDIAIQVRQMPKQLSRTTVHFKMQWALGAAF